MNAATAQFSHLPRPIRWLAAGLPLLVIALGLLAVRPDWHEAMHVQTGDAPHHDHGHQDAAAEERGCVIELFAAGQVEHLAGDSHRPAPSPGIIVSLLLPDEHIALAATCLEPPGRGPPSVA